MNRLRFAEWFHFDVAFDKVAHSTRQGGRRYTPQSRDCQSGGSGSKELQSSPSNIDGSSCTIKGLNQTKKILSVHLC